MVHINTEDITLEQQCIVDEAKVFYHEGKVYRAIYDPVQVKLYLKLFNEIGIQQFIQDGLVESSINSEIKLKGCELVIEHEKIDFILHPAEMTDTMFWEAALSFIKLSKRLAEHGLMLKDAHPWNMSFHQGKPVFFDFSSIARGPYNINWLNEFYTYFAVPVFLAKSKWHKLAIEYRRQQHVGFGLKLSGQRFIKKLFFRSYFKLASHINNPKNFLQKLEDWLLNLKPTDRTGRWDSYDQQAAKSLDAVSVKQQFLYDCLYKSNPAKVVDLATNKGHYAYIAESIGSRVVAFDYEASAVDIARRSGVKKNITFCQMNFLIPTPPGGWGLIIPDAFTRFNSNIAIALGLIHHICLTQGFPVKLFCDSCARFATDGVILEFVYPEDIHVKQWNIKIPHDYNKETIIQYFRNYYNEVDESEMITENAVKRQFLFFHSKSNVYSPI